MNTYFNINYEFDKQEIHRAIETAQKGYICVADGTVMRYVHQDMEYRKVINDALVTISDSSWTPVFLKWIYRINVEPYPGPQLFMDVIKMKKYKMFFMGSSNDVLNALKGELSKIDVNIKDMQFMELPFRKIDDFDYQEIAEMVNKDNPDIIWVSLGAPKQEYFMNRLNPFINRGVQIAVGAAFKFYSGKTSKKRAPLWIHKLRLEFLYRMMQEPKKQWGRFLAYLKVLPSIYYEEIKKNKYNHE